MPANEQLRLLKYLGDALSAAHEIQVHTIGLSERNFFQTNIKWLVERGIEIISEALKRPRTIQPNLAISDLNRIFATRNKIAHEYDIIDPLQLYNIASKNIPLLIEELKLFIEKIEGEV